MKAEALTWRTRSRTEVTGKPFSVAKNAKERLHALTDIIRLLLPLHHLQSLTNESYSSSSTPDKVAGSEPLTVSLRSQLTITLAIHALRLYCYASSIVTFDVLLSLPIAFVVIC